MPDPARLPTDAPFTAADLTAAREALGLSRDALAAELGLTPAVIDAWEAGTLAVPKDEARQLRYRVAVQERDRLVAAAGLPECATADAILARAQAFYASGGKDLKSANAILREMETHRRDCPTCETRRAFVATLPPLPEMPLAQLGGGAGIMLRLSETIGRLPAWARPAAWGAIIIGAMVLFRVAIAMLARGPSVRLLQLALMGILVGGAMGAIGGITYALVRPRTRRFGRAGDYLTGIACVAAYLAALLVPMAIWGSSDDSNLARSGGGLFIFVAMSILFGMVVGHWFGENEA